MNHDDPERLLAGAGSEMDRALLASARADRGSSRAAQRSLAAVAATLAATKTSAAAVSTVALALKYVGIGVVAGVVSITAVQAVSGPAPGRAALRSASTRQPTPMKAQPRGEHQPAAERTVQALSVDPAEPSLAPPAPALVVATDARANAQRARGGNSHPKTTTAPVASAPAAPASAAPEPAEAAASTQAQSASNPNALAGELAFLDDARRSLAAHDPSSALGALDARERAFGAGLLGPEALLLRIEALLARGDRAQAERLGQTFLKGHTRGPHVTRIRALLSLE